MLLNAGTKLNTIVQLEVEPDSGVADFFRKRLGSLPHPRAAPETQIWSRQRVLHHVCV